MRRPARRPIRPKTVSIVLTRTERDALRPELPFGLDGAPPDLDSREQALDYRARLDLVIALHDDLGWSPDDARERFTVTAPPQALHRWLSDLRVSATRAVRDEHRALQALLDDGDPDDGALAGAVRAAKAAIDGDLETIHACDAVLARLPAERPRRALRPTRSEPRRSLAGAPAPR